MSNSQTVQIITFADVQRIMQVVNSYIGFCKGKRSYARRKEILLQFGHKFYHYFYIHGHYERIKLKQTIKPLHLTA